MNKPLYVKVDNKEYKINTDFRVALECNQISLNKSIGDYERALAIIYKLFGEDGLACENQNKLLKLGLRYLSMSNGEKSTEKHSDDKYDLDFIKCEGLIRSSFKFDYKYDPYELEYLHWYDFQNDLQNLSTSEFGNCCILNRVNMILHQDLSKIKDDRQRNEMAETKENLRKKYCINVEVQLTPEQEASVNEFYRLLQQKGG